MPDKSMVYDIAPASDSALLCPSAQTDMRDARILGVVSGTAANPELQYLNEHVEATNELLATAAPATPGQIFLIAARCDEAGCVHFDGTRCRLATRIVQILPPVTEGLPACMIRRTCRWYQQEGRAACFRCPQVVTETYAPGEDYERAALGT